MQKNTLGPLGPVSRLTLGGGGIGQLWGEVSADEAKDGAGDLRRVVL